MDFWLFCRICPYHFEDDCNDGFFASVSAFFTSKKTECVFNIYDHDPLTYKRTDKLVVEMPGSLKIMESLPTQALQTKINFLIGRTWWWRLWVQWLRYWIHSELWRELYFLHKFRVSSVHAILCLLWDLRASDLRALCLCEDSQLFLKVLETLPSGEVLPLWSRWQSYCSTKRKNLLNWVKRV